MTDDDCLAFTHQRTGDLSNPLELRVGRRTGSGRLTGAMCAALSLLALVGATPAFGRAVYVTSFASPEVSRIDTRTNQVIGLPLMIGPTSGIAFGPGGATGYLTNGNPSGIAVLGTASGMVVKSIPLGISPQAITIAPDGKSAYAIGDGKLEPVGEFAAYRPEAAQFDLATGESIGSPFWIGGTIGTTWPLAITPDGQTAYRSDGSANTVTAIDLKTRQILKTIPTGTIDPTHIVISSDGKTAYVANGCTHNLLEIDTATNEPVKTIPIEGGGGWGCEDTGGAIGYLALTPDGKILYFDRPNRGTVERLDTKTSQIVGSPIRVGRHPWGMAITPNGNTVYVANTQSGTVSAIDTRTNRVVGEPTVRGEPWNLAIGASPVSSVAIVIAASKAPVRRGRAHVKLYCDAPPAVHCRGSLRLAITIRDRAHPRQPRKMALGHVPYRLASEAEHVIRVPLNRRARRLVARFGHLRARADATVAGGRGSHRKIVLVSSR